VLIEAILDAGLSVQLKHDSREDQGRIGDVVLKSAEGAVLAACPKFQHNSNFMRREEFAADLAQEVADALEGAPTGGKGEMAAAEEECCGKKEKTGGDCCGAYKKAAKDCSTDCSTAEKDCCAHDAKAAEATSCAAGSCCSSGGCCYSTPQMLMIGLGLALALTFYFSWPAAAAPVEAAASILPDGMVGETTVEA